MTETQSAGGLSVGDVVAERYRIEAVLGEGGMGVVYRAEHLHLRKPFALKVLLHEWTTSPEIVARFEREAIAAGNIQSPHVAAATDFGRLPDGTFFLVMEYVEGRTLRSVLDTGGALEPGRALRVARGIASGLHAAHLAGVVHRDMKPENVMLVERDADPDFVKLLDFGIAKVEPTLGAHSPAGASPLTRVGSVMGTPDYMSPEQALGQPVDARTDQYALGVMLFEMLTGVRPFEGDPVSVLRQRVVSPPPELPVSLAGGVDAGVGAILRRLLAPSPENRFASAAELLAAMDEGTRDAPVPAKTPASRDSTGAVTTPVATRVRRSLLASLGTLREEARIVLANPRTLLREKRGMLVSGIVTIAFFVGLLTMLVVRSGAPPDHRSPAAATAAPVTTASPVPPSTATQPGGMADLPPPPAPSSSAGSAGSRPPQSQGSARRTGPGGIYVPPPSQWFR